jgi:hypothetical protein
MDLQTSYSQPRGKKPTRMQDRVTMSLRRKTVTPRTRLMPMRGTAVRRQKLRTRRTPLLQENRLVLLMKKRRQAGKKRQLTNTRKKKLFV